MIWLVAAGISLTLSMVFGAMGSAWGWFLWWALALSLGVVGAIRSTE